MIQEQRSLHLSSFIFLQGLETLSLRVERHVENALKVVQYLNNHPQVEKVHHPSVTDDPEPASTVCKNTSRMAVDLSSHSKSRADAQTAKDFIDNLELFSLLANVADVKSLVIHPATTTHSQLHRGRTAGSGYQTEHYPSLYRYGKYR